MVVVVDWFVTVVTVVAVAVVVVWNGGSRRFDAYGSKHLRMQPYTVYESTRLCCHKALIARHFN